MDVPMEANAMNQQQLEHNYGFHQVGGNPINMRSEMLDDILRTSPGSPIDISAQDAEEYERTFWPMLEAAIHKLLTLSPGEYVPLSYEQMYSCVYKCVCKHLSEKLYEDLMTLITCHLQKVSADLQCVDQCVYIIKFNAALNQYLQGLGGIVPIFNYMNRFYVESKLNTDLKTELLRLFSALVADQHIPKLIPMLNEAQTKPFSVMPEVMANLVKNLYLLKPEFAMVCPVLFSKYIPNVLPPMNIGDLPTVIEATRKEQEVMLNDGFVRGTQDRKRSVSEDALNNSDTST